MQQEEGIVKGYKVFNSDWTCGGKQYSCPGKFEEDGALLICEHGMHFCKRLADCFNYDDFDIKNHVAEVVAYGKVVSGDDKCVTDKLGIIREIPWRKVLEMVNVGKACTSVLNTGDRNTGYRNTGNGNIGNYNTGYQNTGNRNTGNYNTGDWNTGDWNTCRRSSGCFNTVEQTLSFFNKPSNWTYRDWVWSDARAILCTMPSKLAWVDFADMTADEKIVCPDAKTTDGYLKEYSVSEQTERVNRWWRSLPNEKQESVMSMPNFDKEIFKQITCIDVDAERIDD